MTPNQQVGSPNRVLFWFIADLWRTSGLTQNLKINCSCTKDSISLISAPATIQVCLMPCDLYVAMAGEGCAAMRWFLLIDLCVMHDGYGCIIVVPVGNGRTDIWWEFVQMGVGARKRYWAQVKFALDLEEHPSKCRLCTGRDLLLKFQHSANPHRGDGDCLRQGQEANHTFGEDKALEAESWGIGDGKTSNLHISPLWIRISINHASNFLIERRISKCVWLVNAYYIWHCASD
jgi:hypothetical protein